MESVEPLIGLSFEELRQELERVRGKMPASTLYNQINKLNIVPDLDGYYSPSDLDILKQLNNFLKRVPSIAKFRKALEMEMRNHAY